MCLELVILLSFYRVCSTPLIESCVLQMLVYEFMPNGTLRDHLSAKTERPLSFGQRVHIALGAAKGILYLHTEANPPIFHRDVKASNILLDSKFVAKVADFGLSRLAPVPDIEGTLPAHISTVVQGTPVSDVTPSKAATHSHHDFIYCFLSYNSEYLSPLIWC